MSDVKVMVEVDCREVDIAIEKAERLHALLDGIEAKAKAIGALPCECECRRRQRNVAALALEEIRADMATRHELRQER